MPWQRPGLLGFVMGGQELFPGPLAAMNLAATRTMIAPPIPKLDMQVPHDPDHAEPPQKRIKVSAAQDEIRKREKLISGWELVVGKSLESSKTGRQVKEDVAGP
eukprot:4486051-Karenia_brevis.AAC.1